MSEMRRVALTLAVLGATALAGALQASASPGGAATGTGRAVVLASTPELPGGDGPAAESRRRELRARSGRILDRLADANDLTVETRIPEIGLLSVDLGPGGLGALRRRLANDRRVESVRPDVPVELRFSPDDFAFTHGDVHAPNGDIGSWNVVREGGPRAWDLSRGTGAEVAMVDSGADGGHPDLAGRIVGGRSFGTSSSPTTDQDGHGTHTAGLACGTTGNGYGIASLGFGCRLFIAKIVVDGPCSNVASAITEAGNRRSAVISMSIGGCDSTLVPALNYAQSRGSVIVAAADNEPNPTGSCGGLFDSFDCIYPEEWAQPLGTGPNAGFDRGLVVTSARYDGARSSFAEATSRVSVAAYGSATNAIGGQQGILSTWPGNSVTFDDEGGRTSINGDSRFSYLTGTSMATPQVAGVAALIRAVQPAMANTKVVDVIKATASHCGTYGEGIGWGIVRADEAVIAALRKDVDPPSSHVRSAKRVRRRGASASRARGRLIRVRLKRRDAALPHCANGLPVSGVKKVIVFASANNRPYHRIKKTRKKVLLFRAKPRRRYAFYSVAVDKEGNREAPPSTADARAR